MQRFLRDETTMRKWRPSGLIRISIFLHALALIVFILKPDTWPWLLSALLLDHALLTLLGLWPRSHGLGSNWTELPPAAAARNAIALTIDDGPDPLVTPQVLELLARNQVRATFFCIGERAAHFPELCKEIVQRGHAIENHTQCHRHTFAFLGPRGFAREIQAAQHTLTSLTGVAPKFFRAPAGLRNPLLDPILARLGLQLASWSVRGFDTQTIDPGEVKKRILAKLRPGAIVLMHDGNAARSKQGLPIILEVLPALIEAARGAQLHFVTLREAQG